MNNEIKYNAIDLLNLFGCAGIIYGTIHETIYNEKSTLLENIINIIFPLLGYGVIAIIIGFIFVFIYDKVSPGLKKHFTTIIFIFCFLAALILVSYK